MRVLTKGFWRVYSVGMRDDEKLVNLDLELDDELQQLVVEIFINEGRRREREEIIASLMELYNLSCCCDSASFGQHYLSPKQPDNLVDLINKRPITYTHRKGGSWDGSGWDYRS